MLKTLAVALVLTLAGLHPAFAEDLDPAAPISPEMLKSAGEGDATSLYNLGWIYMNREASTENSVKAEEYFEKTLDAYKDATGDDIRWKGETLANLGLIYLNRGTAQDLTTAATYLDHAASLLDTVGEDGVSTRRVALFNLGWLYLKKGSAEDLGRARTYVEDAIAAYGNPVGDELYWKGVALRMLGDIALASSHYVDAISAHDQAIAVFTTMDKAKGDWVGSLESKGAALQGLSKYAESIELFKQSREMRIELYGDMSSQVADTYLDQGISEEGMHDYQRALDTYSQALLRYAKVLGEDAAPVGWAVNNIGWVQRRLEQYSQSRDSFLRALPIIDREEGRFSRNAGKVRINIGIVEHYLGNQDSAIRWTMQAMPYITANNETTVEEQRWAYDTLARAFRSKGDADRAIAFAKLAVNAQQSIRSNNKALSDNESKELKDEWRWLYQHLADMLIEKGRFAEAQAVLNMEKEQEVFEFLRRDGSADLRDTRALLNNSELSEEAKIQALSAFPLAAAQELQTLTAKLDAGQATREDEDKIFLLQESVQVAVDDFDKQVDAFLQSAAGPQQQVYKDQLDAVGSYQQMLGEFKEKTAILQVAALDDAAHIFLTLPELTIHRETKIAKTELSRMTFEALTAIGSQSPDANDKLARLYDTLIRPVAGDLAEAGVKVVMLNLDGFLRYVPFAALYDGNRYFVQDYAIALYTPSVPTRFSRADREADKSAGFGVTEAHPGFSALPGVKKELQTIFAGTDHQGGVLHGPAALDQAFSERTLRRTLLGKPEILHIASHFNLIPGREDDSFLLLGDGSHLPLSEIRTKKALSFGGIDLVTLSACQTALGSGDGSEIEGFGATAQLNGASAVMASLWPVADEATARLMGDFYDGMVRDGLSKAEALREAQIRMLTGGAEVAAASDERSAASMQKKKPAGSEGFSHPYFWSPFVLMGNWL